jgi:hypothetical protein
MNEGSMMNRWQGAGLAGLLLAASVGAQAQDKAVYRCPGNLYTDALSAKEAIAKGCKTLEGAPITVIQGSPRPAAKSGSASGSSAGNSAGGDKDKVSAQDQKARDADARQILEAELRKEEEALAALRKEYNNGEVERRGDERQSAKYNDRVNELKNSITRKEADVASIRRELAKLGSSAPSTPTAPGAAK